MIICENCNKEFTKESHGRKPRFCCESCRREWWKNNPSKSKRIVNIKTCENCGGKFKTTNKKQRFCSKDCGIEPRRGRTYYKKICPYCNKEFSTIYKRVVYCTSACGSRYNGLKMRRYKKCEYCGKDFYTDHYERTKYCSVECVITGKYGTKEERMEKKFKEKLEKYKVKECLFCKKTFVTNLSYKVYCSDICAYENQKILDRKKLAENYIPKEITCKECGISFTTNVGDKRTEFCSNKCRNKYHSNLYKDKRKKQLSRVFMEKVYFNKIYKRDKGICQICGKPVKYDKRPENPVGATIDHIIPLSKGGLHSMDNCQLAHRICNSLKSDIINYVYNT